MSDETWGRGKMGTAAPVPKAGAAPKGPKRFYKAAETSWDGESAQILLDGRPVRTPLKADFAVPSKALGEAIAEEWRAQDDHVDPGSMPLTRLANTAIDRVPPQRAMLVEALAGYGESDLVCYRAEHPAELAAEQAKAWQPLLDWAERTFGIALIVTEGVAPVSQPAGSIEALARVLDEETSFSLAAVHEIITITGSAIIGLAVRHGEIGPDEAFDAAHLDESWNVRQWGEDAEAAARLQRRRADLRAAAQFLSLL